MKGILGTKIGMTQIFLEDGQSMAASILEVKPNVVTKVFNLEKDGYQALQLAAIDKKAKKLSKPKLGIFQKLNITPKQYLKEIRHMTGFDIGQEINLSIFEVGQAVDISAISKGKGFAGTIKRHNQKIGPKSHGGGGGSKPIRQTGSIGDITGNKVFKGMTMPGRLGGKKVTVQNLEILHIDLENNLLVVKGSVPGPKKTLVTIKNSVKNKPKSNLLATTKLVNFSEGE